MAAVRGPRLFAPAEVGLAHEQTGLRGGERVTLNGMEVEHVASPGRSLEGLSYVFHSVSGQRLYSAAAR